MISKNIVNDIGDIIGVFLHKYWPMEHTRFDIVVIQGFVVLLALYGGFGT